MQVIDFHFPPLLLQEHENGDDGVDPPMHTCVVQYIVFPPHTKTIDDRLVKKNVPCLLIYKLFTI